MTTKSFIKTIGQKGLLADYNTEGKKLQTEDSIDQTYSSTSTKAQSGVAVNEAFKTRETSSSDDSYTYLGMSREGATESGAKRYWKLVSFKPISNFWTLQFEIDVCNGRKAERSFDSCIYETKRLTIYGYDKNIVDEATELRYISQSNSDSRGYGNNIYYEIDSSKIITVYIYAKKTYNDSQICRLTNVMNLSGIDNLSWYEPVADAGTQPSNPIKFKEAFPSIASKTSDIGSVSVPVYVNKGKPVACNSSNLKAGKDDDGNVIKNTYQKKLTFDTAPTAGSKNPVTSDGIKTAIDAKQNSLTAGDNITIDSDTISSNQVFVATYGTTTYQEIKDAYNAGKICIVIEYARYYLMTAITNNSIRFGTVSNTPYIYTFTVASDNKWSISNQWLQTHLTFDTAPTAGSTNPVTSDGIKTALDSRIPAPTSTTGTQVLKCIDGVIQWVTE